MQAELERLATSIRTLKDLQGTAPETIALADARIIALATYFLIGELANRTDLQPIKNYSDPAKQENRIQGLATADFSETWSKIMKDYVDKNGARPPKTSDMKGQT